MAERYARYGLKENPFEVRPLNPQVDPEDLKRIVRLVKFHLDDIDNTLQNKIDAGEPVFFVVSGKSGTGRTSVANYILTRYRDLKGYEQFVIPPVTVNHSVPDVFRNWMLRLRGGIRQKKLDIGELSKSILDQVQTTPDNLLNSVFLDLALEVSQALDQLNPKAGFGVYLEDIPTMDLFEAAMDIFRDSSTACVMTVSESALAVMDKKPAVDVHIALEEIEGRDVWEIIDKRWVGNAPNPFDPNGVVKAFDQKLSIARAMVLMRKILATMLDYHPHGDEWPRATELHFSEELLVNQINTHMAPEWRHGGE